MKTRKTFNPTKLDKDLLVYLHANKVASGKQIHRDIYQNHSPQSVRYCLKKMRDGKLIKAAGAIPDRGDDSYIYSLTKNGFRFIQHHLSISLTNNRIKSDSEEHDLNLLDIRNILLSKTMVQSYYSENQIQSYANFSDVPDLNVFKRLRLDSVLLCQKDKRKAFFGIQYERSRKNEGMVKKIMTDYYTEPLLNFVLYICENTMIEDQLKKVELAIAKDSDKKLYFIQFEDLIQSKQILNFKNQDNEILQMN